MLTLSYLLGHLLAKQRAAASGQQLQEVEEQGTSKDAKQLSEAMTKAVTKIGKLQY